MIFNLNNEYEHGKFKAYCERLLSKGSIVEVKKKHPQRSMAQNSYLHLLLSYFASEFGYSVDEVKFDIYKKTCNKDIFIAKRFNRRGEEVSYVRSSAELDRQEMTLSIERFRNYSASQGLYLPSPSEQEALVYVMQQVNNYQEFL